MHHWFRRAVAVYDWVARIHFGLFVLGGAGVIVSGLAWALELPLPSVVALIAGGLFIVVGAVGWHRSRSSRPTAQATANVVESAQEAARRRRLVDRLHGDYWREYILSHDGITPRQIAGLEPAPLSWLNRRLRQLGETWPADEYYAHARDQPQILSDRPVPEDDDLPATVTPESLAAMVDGLSGLQSDAVVRELLGKRMTVRDRPFGDANQHDSSRITVTFRDQYEPVIYMYFGLEWKSAILALRPGASITVRGTLDKVIRGQVGLINCELVDTGSGQSSSAAISSQVQT